MNVWRICFDRFVRSSYYELKSFFNVVRVAFVERCNRLKLKEIARNSFDSKTRQFAPLTAQDVLPQSVDFEAYAHTVQGAAEQNPKREENNLFSSLSGNTPCSVGGAKCLVFHSDLTVAIPFW